MQNSMDAFLFVVRATTKVGRDLSDRTVSIWPYSSMARAMWSTATFPGDEWPGTYNNMLTCVTLNIGLYVYILMIATLVAFNSATIVDVADAHTILFQDMKHAIRRDKK